jgi:histidine triad (HIT) family protein
MDCIFCRIVRGEIPSTPVLETHEVLAFRDLNPQAPNHILVIPRVHVASLAELGPGDVALGGALLTACAQVARESGLDAGGYRVVTNVGEDGGQSVGHLHLHVLGGRSMGWPPG